MKKTLLSFLLAAVFATAAAAADVDLTKMSRTMLFAAVLDNRRQTKRFKS